MKHEFDISAFRYDKVEETLKNFKLSRRVKKFVVDTLLRREGVDRFITDGRVIYIAVTSNGLTGNILFRVLLESNIVIDEKVKSILLSGDYVATNDVTTIVAIVNGRLFHNNSRTTSRAKSFARDNRLYTINADTAISLRLKLTNECVRSMGLNKIVVMHDPLKDEEGVLRLINVSTVNEKRYLTARSDNNSHKWSYDVGFAFEVLRVKN